MMKSTFVNDESRKSGWAQPEIEHFQTRITTLRRFIDCYNFLQQFFFPLDWHMFYANFLINNKTAINTGNVTSCRIFSAPEHLVLVVSLYSAYLKKITYLYLFFT